MKQAFIVRGMTCGHCVARVTSELENSDKITGVTLSLETGELDIDSTEEISLQEMQDIVSEAGAYRVEKK